jgi:hypothetical protein
MLTAETTYNRSTFRPEMMAAMRCQRIQFEAVQHPPYRQNERKK